MPGELEQCDVDVRELRKLQPWALPLGDIDFGECAGVASPAEEADLGV